MCAERNAIGRAVSEHGKIAVSAVVVVRYAQAPFPLADSSDLPTPSVSPCGVCRQTLREFTALDAPVYMLAASYPWADGATPSYIKPGKGDGLPTIDEPKVAVTMTLEELLPMSFGPEALAAAK